MMYINSTKKISKLLIFMPIYCILGLKFFIIHLISLLLFMDLLKNIKLNNFKVKIHTTHKILFIYIMVYTISITINVFQSDISRIVASIYNLSFWIMGFFIMISIYNDDSFDKNAIKLIIDSNKNFSKFVIILFILSLIIFYIGYENFHLLGFSRKILPKSLVTGLLSMSTAISFFQSDWLNGTRVFRFVGGFNYPAASALGISFLFLVYYYKCRISKILKKQDIVMAIILFVSFILCLSRITWIGMFISVIFVHLISNYNPDKKQSLIKIIVFIFIITIIIPIFIKSEVLSNIYNSREGSNTARLLVYEEAISVGIKNPILGVGIKYDDPNFLVPVGSHSTYIGSFMKTGSIGLILITLFVISMIYTWFKIRRDITDKEQYILWKICGVFLLMSTIWMLTEDMDAPQIVALFYFINCSIILKLKSINFNIIE